MFLERLFHMGPDIPWVPKKIQSRSARGRRGYRTLVVSKGRNNPFHVFTFTPGAGWLDGGVHGLDEDG
jgi:hypothetical protein